MLLGSWIWDIAEIVPVVSFGLLLEGTSVKIPIQNIIALAWMCSVLMSARLKSYYLLAL